MEEIGEADLNSLGISIQDEKNGESRIEIKKLEISFSICIENGEIKINEN